MKRFGFDRVIVFRIALREAAISNLVLSSVKWRMLVVNRDIEASFVSSSFVEGISRHHAVIFVEKSRFAHYLDPKIQYHDPTCAFEVFGLVFAVAQTANITIVSILLFRWLVVLVARSRGGESEVTLKVRMMSKVWC
jgi:hypothetical protein